MEFKNLILSLCKRPSMHVGTNNFSSVVAYLDGYNLGKDFKPLGNIHATDCFQKWLVKKFKAAPYLHWSGIIRHYLSVEKPQDDLFYIQETGRLLIEWLEVQAGE